MPSTFGTWEAAVNGNTPNLNATNHANQINQILGTHAVTPIYKGSQIVTPAGGTGGFNFFSGNNVDIAQGFTMPVGKTVVSRVSMPIVYSGSGADVVVSLLPQAGGVPDFTNTLARTVIPYQHLQALTAPTGLANAGPLAVPQNYNVIGRENIPTVPWGSATVDNTGTSISNQATTVSGNYLISAGGQTGTVTGAVLTAQFNGKGSLGTPLLQPSIPQASFWGMLAATTDSLVYAGGNLNTGSFTANTYTASWNNLTGEIGAWSLQAAMPVALERSGVAAYNNTVYIIGGVDSAGNLQKAVYTANVSNGQISVWNRGPDYPIAVQQMAASVVNGWLIVAGGNIATPGTTCTAAVYYSKINADGSLGTWQAGPNLPTPVATWSPGWNQMTTADSFGPAGGIISGPGNTNNLQTISVNANGLGDYWKVVTTTSGALITAAFPLSNGQWNLFFPRFGASFYQHTVIGPMPFLSVPLYATGLTPGNVYYVMYQEHQYISSSDFTSILLGNGALPIDALSRSRNNPSASWANLSTGFSIPLAVYDNTPGGQPIHTWEDPESTGSTATSNFAGRTTSFIYGLHNNLLGVADSTVLPNDPLNKNPTFTTNVANWTPHNCTFVQSNAQTHGGFPFSGLMTPNGVAAAPNVTSELVVIKPVSVAFGIAAVTALLNGWFYSPTGYSNVSLSADWYDAGLNYLTTTNNTTTIPAATWTNFVSFYRPPANSFYVSINMIEAGTPAAGNTLFFSNVSVTLSTEQTTSLPSVAQINYPSIDTWPPSGITQLY